MNHTHTCWSCNKVWNCLGACDREPGSSVICDDCGMNIKLKADPLRILLSASEEITLRVDDWRDRYLAVGRIHNAILTFITEERSSRINHDHYLSASPANCVPSYLPTKGEDEQ